ncbi:MAG: thiamine pyrophosphate-dependent enzyme [Inhella sp.]
MSARPELRAMNATDALLQLPQEALERALLARFTEEKLLDLFSQGALFGTVHTCIGQELSGALVGRHLRAGDTVFSNHRCHGHFLGVHRDVEALIAELMGRSTGVSGGIGGSQHLCREGFHSNGIQGGIVPVAGGQACAHKLAGGEAVAVVFVGDGTLGEGALYEALNLVSKWELPLLVVLEDNGYAQSTAQQETLAGSIQARAQAFGIETAEADTWHPLELDAQLEAFIQAMRQDRKPRFLHLRTFRLKAHSKGDDTRARELVSPFEERDPLNQLLASGRADSLVERLRAEVQQAADAAAQAPHATAPRLPAAPTAQPWQAAELGSPRRLVAALNDSLGALLDDDPRVLLIGEDIESPYGGAFKATKDLSARHPGRVRNTPISEAGIVGLGSGLALQGWRPLVEIMFGDFLGLAFDQLLNHAAKFRAMYDEQVRCPLVVRTPMGGGRGYGPTHSQSIEKHFLGMPGLRVLALNSLTRPDQLYPALLQQDDACLVVENKLLYGELLGAPMPEGWELLHSAGAFPCAWLRPRAARVDVTLLGYGGMTPLLVQACERLFNEHDLIAQVLVPMQLYPFTPAQLHEPLAAAPALLVVEEGQGFAGFGAELIGQLAEGGALPRRCGRLHAPPTCIPASGPLEKALLPSVDGVLAAARELCA